MAAQPFEQQFRSSARFLPQMLDVHQDKVLVVLAEEQDYRSASFLDQRLLAANSPRQWLPWDELAAITGRLPDTSDFIFHVGHVGSTLISRLLGELPRVLAVREPLLLRSLAELRALTGRPESPWSPELFDLRLAIALGWLSRTFRPGQRAMIKATSFVSELAAPILKPGRRALFLYAQPRTYLETILASEASRLELAALAGARLQRLHRRIGEEPWRLWALSAGERAAMAWAAEMTALERGCADADEKSVLWMEFDRFLEAPAPSLSRIAAHFEQRLGACDLAALIGGPIMNSYSKAPEHGYSPGLREEVLAAARAEHSEEIRRGLAWLEAAALRHPPIAAVLARAASGAGGA